ncbi:EAL domain-containing protein [Vibrio mediterranei]|uniref:EAL domain-containing protein n=1 Tax=Vibrio mediterranei TaxID=689 RepID=UPI00148C73A7|nr:EAL domain-containing protein [Vibrio mediterranei]NOI25981.1 EAL domain-containing protein [Vibrio mediterranei]
MHLLLAKPFYDYFQEYLVYETISILLFVLAMLFFLRLIIFELVFRRNQLKLNLEHSKFIPYYQPIVDSRTNEVLGAEVLIRVRQPDGSLVHPHQFITEAEESGLIIPITYQLIEKVLIDLTKLDWDSSRKFVSINVVPELLVNDKLCNRIVALCSFYKVPTSLINLEITERLKIPDLDRVKGPLNNFRKQGINIKLDDVGTGYGGFRYIQELDIDSIKIDKMFVDSICDPRIKCNVLDAIIAFIKTSGLEAIAEGVENVEQLEYLSQNGIYNIQGYIYAKPMAFVDFKYWFDKFVDKANFQNI